MDGYAVRAADTTGASEATPKQLRVVGEVAAGYIYRGEVGPGEAVRIMTGAPVPAGADPIVPFEETDERRAAPSAPSRRAASQLAFSRRRSWRRTSGAPARTLSRAAR